MVTPVILRVIYEDAMLDALLATKAIQLFRGQRASSSSKQ